MFDNKIKEQKEVISQLNSLLKDERQENFLRIKELEQEHELVSREKEFQMKHYKNERIKELDNELIASNQKMAVLEKENEMLKKITDLNADIIDIKDLVSNLITKLPEIKLDKLTISNNNK